MRDRAPDPRHDPVEIDLGLLGHDVFEHAEIPGSAHVDEPARRRTGMRLAVSGTLVAAAAVVATLVLAPGLGTLPEPAPDPGTPSPSPTFDAGYVPPEVKQLIADERTDRLLVSGGLDGSVAVIWRELDGNPRFALVTRNAKGVTTGQIIEAPFGLTPIPGGWVAMRSYRAYLLTPDGRLRDFPIQAVAAPRAGDIQVDAEVYGQGRPFLYRPTSGLLAPMSILEEHDATYLTREGHLITYDRRSQQISSPTGGGTTVSDRAANVAFVGRDGIVVALVLGDEPDGSVPLLDIAISRDGGRLWEHTMLRTTKSVEVTSAAVGSDGSVLVATSEDGVFTIRAGGSGISEEGLLLNLVAQTGSTLTYGWDTDKTRAYVNSGGEPNAWEVLTDSFL